jgi:hypothetical protein
MNRAPDPTSRGESLIVVDESLVAWTTNPMLVRAAHTADGVGLVTERPTHGPTRWMPYLPHVPLLVSVYCASEY